MSPVRAPDWLSRYRGSFNTTRPEDLAAHCLKDVLRKTPQLEMQKIEDVILGCAQPHGPQGMNIARRSALLAGLPAFDAGCRRSTASAHPGLQAIAMAAHQIIQEGASAVMAGGVESISMVQARRESRIRHWRKNMPGLHAGNGRNGGGGGEAL